MRLVRKQAIGVFAVVIGSGIALYLLLTDRFIERQLEAVGSSIVGAKVDIDGFHLSLLRLTVKLNRLQVTNRDHTMKNLFETGRMAFRMELWPLLRKKVVINEVTVADFRVGTDRTTDGRVPLPPPGDEGPSWFDQASTQLMSNVKTTVPLDLSLLDTKIDVESILNSLDLQTIQNVEKLEKEILQQSAVWKEKVKSLNLEAELKTIDQRLAAIDLTKIKNPVTLVAALDNAKKLATSLDNIKKSVAQSTTDFGNDFRQLTLSAKQVDDWIKGDVASALAKIDPGQLGKNGLSRQLFGQQLLQPVETLLHYARLSRRHMPLAKAFLAAGKVEKPPRFKGQDIHFSLRRNDPTFLLKKVFLSGASSPRDEAKQISLTGTIIGITSQPRVYGHPTTFELAAQLPSDRRLSVDGLIDHTRDIPKEVFNLQGQGLPLGEQPLPAAKLLPQAVRLNRADISLSVELVGDTVAIINRLIAKPVQFIFAEPAATGKAATLVRDLFSEIPELEIGSEISGIGENLAIKIHSNLDDLLASRLSAALGKEALLANQAMTKRLKAKLDPYRQRLVGLLSKEQTAFSAQLATVQKLVGEKSGLIASKKKELEQKLQNNENKNMEGLNKALNRLKKK